METHRHYLVDYPLQLAARNVLHAPPHRQNIYGSMTRCLVIDHSHNERGNQPLLFPLTLLGLTCTFRASCCSTRLSWAHSPAINWVICLAQLIVTLLEVSEQEEGAVALHLPIGPLKPSLDWSRYRDVNPVPTSPLADDTADDVATAPLELVNSS